MRRFASSLAAKTAHQVADKPQLIVSKSAKVSAIRRTQIDADKKQQLKPRPCRAYCVARQYSLQTAIEQLQTQNYQVSAGLPGYDYVHIKLPSAESEIFVLGDGCLVSWNTDARQDALIRRELKSAEVEPFEPKLQDSEEMRFIVAQDDKQDTGMLGEDIVLQNRQEGNTSIYAKLAFSHGLARSVELGVLENHLEMYLESIQSIPRHMMRGRAPPLSAHELMRKQGELLHIRGLLNLHTDLVDNSPELYWSHAELARYHEQISRTLDISPRIRILNQRLDHASQLITLMQDHLNVRHGVRMEVIIIALIAVEVLFETVHYLDTLNWINLQELLGAPQPPTAQEPFFAES